jgi:DNA invertase Pin-like site-specific DNA recombinase
LKLDRFSREGALETLTYLQKLTQYGVGYRSFTEQYLDSCGMFREAVISILAVIAKQERVRLSERTIAGLPHRNRYYELLQKVRIEGAWEEWFFLEGTEQTARQAANTAIELVRLFGQDRDRIQSIGRAASSALRVHEYMQKKPFMISERPQKYSAFRFRPSLLR